MSWQTTATSLQNAAHGIKGSTMRTETITRNIYTFSELSDKAKDKAIRDYRAADEFPWGTEYKESLEAFVDHFNVNVKDWSIGTCSYSYVTTDAETQHFRGRKLRDFDRDHMPTGFCADCDLWMTFYDQFKATGDAKAAFKSALDAWVKSYVAAMEDAESDESIIENIEANEYEFYKNGERA